jgi:hypothetical protein
VQIFDAREMVDEACLTGFPFGRETSSLAKSLILKAGSGQLWIIDFATASLVTYSFINGFLRPLLDNNGAELPHDVGIVVKCHGHADRREVLDGVARDELEAVNYTEVEAGALIAQRQRPFYLLIDDVAGSVREYVGLDRQDPRISAALAFCDTQKAITVQMLRDAKEWDTTETSNLIQFLQSKRCVLKVGQQGRESLYRSIGSFVKGDEP